VGKKRTNLLILGTLASGSSALVDMLDEYENINVLHYEFNHYRRPGFVSDQLSYESSISYPNVIDKELEFTNSRWKFIYKSSIWKYIPKRTLDYIWEKDFEQKKFIAYKNSLTDLFQIVFLQKLNEGLKSDISFEEKIKLANEWIHNVGSIFPSYYDFTLFNQPLHPWSDMDIWTKVFDPFKMILVYRDPRDQLAEMVRRDIAFYPFRYSKLDYGQFNIISIYGNDRNGRMKFLIDALKLRVDKYDRWLNMINQDQILFVDFEGLVNDYNAYEKRIEQFIGKIEGKHIFRQKYFNPEVAKKNSIGIFSKYLNDQELEDLAPLDEWYRKKISEGKVSNNVKGKNP
jgi:hypothetical protein